MNPLNWAEAHQAQLIALMVAAFCVGTAKKIIPKMRNKERGSSARWGSFVLYVIGGVALAVAMIPLINWVIGLGARTGVAAFLGNLTAIVTFALGWQSFAMIISMIRDLMDRQPDHQARTAALWVPTLAPIGLASVIALLRNPQGLGQGITAAVMGLITLIYCFMIVKRADDAQDHKSKWAWFSFGILVIGGFAIIPMIAYADSALIAQLPSPLPALIRTGLGLGALGAIAAGTYDLWVDRLPEKYARTGAIFGISCMVVFGAIGIAALSGAASDGASVLNGVF